MTMTDRKFGNSYTADYSIDLFNFAYKSVGIVPTVNNSSCEWTLEIYSRLQKKKKMLRLNIISQNLKCKKDTSIPEDLFSYFVN